MGLTTHPVPPAIPTPHLDAEAFMHAARHVCDLLYGNYAPFPSKLNHNRPNPFALSSVTGGPGIAPAKRSSRISHPPQGNSINE